jgi:hypothetical protein
MKSKDYKINSHNSTVCGFPGRDFDWSKFDWEGKTILNRELLKEIVTERSAPLPWVDNGLIEPGGEYLHVPYDWEQSGTYLPCPSR